MSTKLVSFLNFQVLCPLVYTEDHPLNISSGLFCQAAAKGVLWKSCKLMFTQNTRPKRCKMSGQKMLKSQLREQLSNRCLVVAASIELKLYRVWYTGLYPPAFMGWLIQYAAKQGRISSVIEKYELKGPPWTIVGATTDWMQAALSLSYQPFHTTISLLWAKPKGKLFFVTKNLNCWCQIKVHLTIIYTFY